MTSIKVRMTGWFGAFPVGVIVHRPCRSHSLEAPDVTTLGICARPFRREDSLLYRACVIHSIVPAEDHSKQAKFKHR